MSKNYSKADVLNLLALVEAGKPSGYEVPAGEEQKYHVIAEIRRFNAENGQRRSTPRIQKFGVKEWADTLHNLRKLGYTIIVLHDPTEWMKENADKLAAAKAAQTEADRVAAEKKAAEDKAEAAKAQQAAIDAGVKAQLEALGIPAGKTLDQIIAEKLAAATKAAPAKEEKK